MPKQPVHKRIHLRFLKHPLCFVIVGCLLWAFSLPALAQEPMSADENMQQRIERFMSGLEQLQPAWLNHPELMALHWVGLPAPAQRTIKMVCSPLENPQTCNVTVKQGGLLDDAVAGSKTRLTFQAQASGWRLTHVTEQWRCRRLPTAQENAELYQLKPCP